MIHRGSFVGLSLCGACVALCITSCGARTSLEERRASTGEGLGGVGGDGGQGNQGNQGGLGGLGGVGAGGDGGGGAHIDCDTFVWSGDPVLYDVGLAGEPTELELLQASPEVPTLVWVQSTGDPNTMSTTFDGWGTWPPVVPTPTAHLGLQFNAGVEVTRGLPGTFLASGLTPDGATIATSDPQGLLEYTSYEMFSGGTHAVARGLSGDLLVHGPPQTVVASFLPQSGPIVTGTLGCASSAVVAAAVALDDGRFLVASSNNYPFDDCVDPDVPGPATTLQVHRVDQGALTPAYFRVMSSELERIQLVPDSGQGAWLLHRSLGDPELHIERLDGDGQTTYSFSTSGNAIYGDALDDWSTGFVHVNTWPGSPDNETHPFVWLSVHGPDFINQVATLEFQQPISVMQRPPTVLTSPNERSFLVAWNYDPFTIGLLRGECL